MDLVDLYGIALGLKTDNGVTQEEAHRRILEHERQRDVAHDELRKKYDVALKEIEVERATRHDLEAEVRKLNSLK